MVISNIEESNEAEGTKILDALYFQEGFSLNHFSPCPDVQIKKFCDSRSISYEFFKVNFSLGKSQIFLCMHSRRNSSDKKSHRVTFFQVRCCRWPSFSFRVYIFLYLLKGVCIGQVSWVAFSADFNGFPSMLFNSTTARETKFARPIWLSQLQGVKHFMKLLCQFGTANYILVGK